MVDGHRTYRLNAARSSWLRLAQILILLVPMLRAIVKALHTHRTANINSWAMTELMINNTAGFVRRGLGGSLLLWLHQFAPAPFLHEFGLLLALFVIFASSLLILRGCLRVSLFDGLLIMYSPLVYPFFLGYAVETVFRKDAMIVLFVIASLLGLFLSTRRQLLFLIVMACVVLPLMTLTHEMVPFFCFAPLLLIYYPLILNITRSRVAAAAMALGLLLPTLATLAFIRIYSHPTVAMTEQMCLAWQHYYPDLGCIPIRHDSAFSTLADYDISQRTLNWIHSKPTVYRFRLEGLLALTYVFAMAAGPLGRLAAIYASRTRIEGGCIAMLTAFVVFIPTLPMYWLATDFGRWLAIAMTLCVLMICSQRFVASLTQSLNASGFFRLPLPSPAGWARSIYSNLNGFILLINFCLIPQAYSPLLWTYSPQLRIVLKPFGL